jgi:hypothetical protein
VERISAKLSRKQEAQTARRIVDLRFLKELEDQGVIVQLYRQQI